MTQLGREGDPQTRADPLGEWLVGVRERLTRIGVARVALQGGGQHVEQRLVGRESAALIVEEMGDETAGALRSSRGGEVAGELGLPHARLAEHDDRLRAAGERAAQLGAQKLQDVVAADQLVEVGIGGGRGRARHRRVRSGGGSSRRR